MLIYIDDLVLVGNVITEITNIKSFLHHTFNIKDLGHLKYFLGLEIYRSHTNIHLCQCKYALDIFSVTGLLGSKSVCSHMQHNPRLQQNFGTLLSDNAPYRQLVGQLIYLTIIRPDMSCDV